jgi:hypothetical protein
MIAMLGLTAAGTIAVIFMTRRAVGRLVGPLLPLDPRDDSDSDSDGGGGGNIRPQPPSPSGDTGGEPSWWPEFEQQFAEYAGRAAARSD